MSESWFEEGLRFRCRRCGACCTGEPGYVFLDRGEARQIADRLGMTERSFLKRYTRRVALGRSLKEEDDGRCVFFSPEGCAVYDVRPVQCRTFPFWQRIVQGRESWEEEGRDCPGIGRGRLYEAGEIRELLAREKGRGPNS